MELAKGIGNKVGWWRLLHGVLSPCLGDFECGGNHDLVTSSAHKDAQLPRPRPRQLSRRRRQQLVYGILVTGPDTDGCAFGDWLDLNIYIGVENWLF